jgi:hypothetical protein
MPNFLTLKVQVDHLIEFSDLMPDRLEMELIKTGDLPLTAMGLEKMRPDLGYAGAKARMLFQPGRSKASDPKQLIAMLPDLVRTTTQIATFKAGAKRKTTHRHLFLPKNYTGSPTSSVFTPWTLAEVQTHLVIGWGPEAIEDLQLEFLYRPEDEVSGELGR